jgi:hypothetical protein
MHRPPKFHGFAEEPPEQICRVYDLCDPASVSEQIHFELVGCGLDIQFTDLRHGSMVLEGGRVAEGAIGPVRRGQRPLSAPKCLASMVVLGKGDHEWTG